jgi:catechol 2,3-dioxygenase-like lactoylglutathione lyase family enzyme
MEARRFFGDVLGLQEVEKPEPLRARGGVWFALGGQQLHIGVESEFAPALKAHPAFRVSGDAIDDLAARVIAAGHTVEWDESLPEIRRFFTADPWGNRLEILS